MSKRYLSELSRLGNTYEWALQAPIDRLTAAIAASSNLPMVGVGSGGSFSAAHLACAQHQYHTGMVSRPLTPLELIYSPIQLRSASAMLLSARGSNTDIVSALGDTIAREPRRCTVLCLRKGSRLSRVANAYRIVDLIELNPPWAKDGFLATNSLLALGILLVRAYAVAHAAKQDLPARLEMLLPDAERDGAYVEALRENCRGLWKRETILALYGSGVSTAALDLESKFAEAALGNIQLADFRNFAHGRHNWLAKRGSQTGVLAIFADDERVVAEKTLGLIPSTVPVSRICIPGTGARASIAALVAILHFVGAAGRERGLDPGRPGVPTFGRRMYRLQASRPRRRALPAGYREIARKVGCDVNELAVREDLRYWEDAYRRFTARLTRAKFGAVIFDYDGTLCDDADRFVGPRPEVARQLVRLLARGVLVGIATGRGDSVRGDLRKVLPRPYWNGVHLGYYNGSELGCLVDDAHPNPAAAASDSPVKSVADALASHPIISRLAASRPSRDQISVRPSSAKSEELTWRLVQHVAHSNGLTALRSTHSMDLLRQGVSKRSLVSLLCTLLPKSARVLTIGDMGDWPGNDYDLLNTEYSLSVAEVSADPETCWNLAPSGHRGVQALLDYTGWIRLASGHFRLKLEAVGEGP